MASLNDGPDDSQHAAGAKRLIDEKIYRAAVLRSSPEVTEDELDRGLELEARILGLHPSSLSIDCLSCSISATTIASNYQEPSSAISQSTGPTSCSSSERRHTYQPSFAHAQSSVSSHSTTPSISSYTEKKASAFRKGLWRMGMFKKRRSAIFRLMVTPRSTGPPVKVEPIRNRDLSQERVESPVSTTSRESSWSTSIAPTTKTTMSDAPSRDQDITRRTMECLELQMLQARQRDERNRFLEYQKKCFGDLRLEYDKLKQEKIKAQAILIQEARIKNEKAIADLESRQLEAEMDLISQLDFDKRTCLIRLRHMEAYCHTPSPPLSSSTSDRSSWDSHESQRTNPSTPPGSSPSPSLNPNNISTYYRVVTEKDFHNLAQQYRERDSMESLHRSKIDVLRGRQEKQYSHYITKKEKEIDQLEAEQRAEIAKLDTDYTAYDEHALQVTFRERKARLERRWRLECGIEKAKQERDTGLRFAMPENVVVRGGEDT